MKEPNLSSRLSEVTDVRTTLNLTGRAIDRLQELTKRVNSTQKAVLSFVGILGRDHPHFLEDEFRTRSREEETDSVRLRKTYVVTKAALETAEELAVESGRTRDQVFEDWLLRMEIMLDNARNNERKQYDAAKADVGDLCDTVERVIVDIREDTGDEQHPVAARLDIVFQLLANLYSAIESYIDKGIKVDPEDFSQNGKDGS